MEDQKESSCCCCFKRRRRRRRGRDREENLTVEHATELTRIPKAKKIDTPVGNVPVSNTNTISEIQSKRASEAEIKKVEVKLLAIQMNGNKLDTAPGSAKNQLLIAKSNHWQSGEENVHCHEILEDLMKTFVTLDPMEKYRVGNDLYRNTAAPDYTTNMAICAADHAEGTPVDLETIFYDTPGATTDAFPSISNSGSPVDNAELTGNYGAIASSTPAVPNINSSIRDEYETSDDEISSDSEISIGEQSILDAFIGLEPGFEEWCKSPVGTTVISRGGTLNRQK